MIPTRVYMRAAGTVGFWAARIVAAIRHVRIWLHQRHAIRNLITARVYDERGDRPSALHYARKHLEHMARMKQLQQRR